MGCGCGKQTPRQVGAPPAARTASPAPRRPEARPAFKQINGFPRKVKE